MVMDNMKASVTVEREKEVPGKIGEVGKLVSENAALLEKLDAVLSSVSQGVSGEPCVGSPTVDSLTSLGGVLLNIEESLYRNNRVLESILDRLEV